MTPSTNRTARKVKWGVLSTAGIATEKVIPAMQSGQHSQVLAIASRDMTRAAEAAERLGIARSYGSYDELLADPEVEVVYIPLPNHLHIPWSLRALESGKHILCEKPIARSAAEAEPLLQASGQHPQLIVMEAFMYRFHPQWRLVKGWVENGVVGELRTIHTSFSYLNRDEHDIRNQADMGGGGMLDIGCYPVSLSRWMFGAEPTRVLCTIERDPSFGVDRLASGVMEFERGTASFTVATQLAGFQRVNLHGTGGWIEIDIPFNAPPDRPCRVRRKSQDADNYEDRHTGPADQYTLQGDAFSQAVLSGGSPPTPLSDAMANMRVIDALFASAESGAWVEPVRAD